MVVEYCTDGRKMLLTLIDRIGGWKGGETARLAISGGKTIIRTATHRLKAANLGLILG